MRIVVQLFRAVVWFFFIILDINKNYYSHRLMETEGAIMKSSLLKYELTWHIALKVMILQIN